MEITHGIALFFGVALAIISTLLKQALWWLMVILYIGAVSYVAILNNWELLFLPVLGVLGIIALIGFTYSAFKGDII